MNGSSFSPATFSWTQAPAFGNALGDPNRRPLVPVNQLAELVLQVRIAHDVRLGNQEHLIRITAGVFPRSMRIPARPPASSANSPTQVLPATVRK